MMIIIHKHMHGNNVREHPISNLSAHYELIQNNP